MFRKTVFFGLLASFISFPAFAEGTSKEEAAGVGLGVVIGAAAGGPIGAIVGAALGGKIGDELYQRDHEVETLTATLDGSQNRVATLEKNIISLNGEIRSIDGELKEIREFARPELLDLLAAGIEMDLLFRTDEDVLADTTGGKLGQLAASLAANSDIRIRLDGYADERGDAVYNQDLSLRRVEHVRDLLLANGIPAARITTDAHGEAPAVDTNIDSYALQRRVSLVLYMSDTPSFASNPR
jgi:outer membrane protein OmpA-like peptidoglycan-associated protein